MADLKYTKEFVKEEVAKLLNELKEDKNIVYIGELFENKQYSRSRYNERVSDPKSFSDRAARYGNDKEIETMSFTIKEILESRAIVGAMRNKLNATSTIFHLKNNYKRKDKQEIETQQNINIENLKDIPTDELLKYLSK